MSSLDPSSTPLEVFAPYRLSLLGAHTDHQDGLSSGLVLDQGVRFRGRVLVEPELRLSSRDYEGEQRGPFDQECETEGGWGRYARGIACELLQRHGISRGIEGEVEGDLPSGGIASSAAFQLAIALALLQANALELPKDELVDLVVSAERASSGAEVGRLDPAVIVHGRAGSLVFLDFRKGTTKLHRLARSLPAFELALFDVGEPRQLGETPYNARIAECQEAARALGAEGEAPRLRDVSSEQLRRRRAQIDPVLARRAEHVLSENKRMKQGLDALARGDLLSFGRLMTASGESLARNFEVGTERTRAALELLTRQPGVLGASYAGGGFGGHLQALLEPGCFDSVRDAVLASGVAGDGERPFAWPVRPGSGIECRRG